MHNFVVFAKEIAQKHALMRSAKNFKEFLNANGDAVAHPLDLSKEFDCLHRDILIANIHAYSFSRRPFGLI